ncbi:MAG: TIGR02302 family protein [Alphaproteobacteria bacterium]
MSLVRPLASLLERALERRIQLAWTALLWERLWPALWPAVGVAGLFLALALLDAWSLLPGWLHLGLLLAFAGALGWALWRHLSHFTLPTADQARRRLERNNRLDHRPLTLLRDHLASDPSDSGARGLWRVHRARAAAAVRRLRVGMPEPGLARHDPLGLRAALGLLLVVGVTASGLEGPSRVARAFSPDLSGQAVIAAELDAWIAPPDYTALAPIVLAAGSGERRLTIPTGSRFLARVHGGRGAPALRLDEDEVAFERVDPSTHRLEYTIERGERLAVVQDGGELAAWPLTVVADEVPRVVFAEPPSRSLRSALRVEYEASDDYGLASVTLRIRRAERDERLEIALPLPGLGVRNSSEASFHDLTPHPWAGLTVTLDLMARDGIDQEGFSGPFEMVLPERIFNHPVARAIIEQRKALTLDPGRRDKVVAALDAISALPEHFFDDVVVYMALRSARWRLAYDASEKAIAEVQDLLWDTALRIEDGTLSLAERELRAAQEALMEALGGDATDAEIERLMDALRQALNDFLRALAEQAMAQAAEGDPIEGVDPDSLMIESQDLMQLLEQALELSRSGAREAARELLAQLQEMLENLRAGVMTGMSRDGDQRYGRNLRELGELMRRQQQLLDETFRESRRGQGEMQRPGPGIPGMAGRQEGLRRSLGEIMRRLGEGQGQIPGGLGRAERAMREARRALEGGESGVAARSQTTALDELRQGARALIEEMMQRFGNLGDGQQGRGRSRFNNRDPLGRPLPGGEEDGGITGDYVKIPDKADLQRAREILDELYRRSGERQRPPAELDYIDRLLRRF